MSSYERITADDVASLTSKLTDWARSSLNPQEQTALAGVLELAGKMYEGTGRKKTLPLSREAVRDLNVWERLIETQGHSLWTCDKPPIFREDVVNPS